jgi:23S rRNA (cytosine1962-C5)-methyltransferase
MTEGIIRVHKDREKPIANQHPWIFSRAIEQAKNVTPGELVTVVSQKGEFLARGYYNPRSQIQVRILTWKDEPIDDSWWHQRLQRAIDTRTALLRTTSAVRLIHAENDFLPGLVVDLYGDRHAADRRWLVLQALTLGIDRRKQQIAGLLHDLLHPAGIYERSDVDVRGKEGLKPVSGLLSGDLPPDALEIHEYGVPILVDIAGGHKTGAYLDQRPNRRLLHDLIQNEYTQRPCRVLNTFCYTGGFSSSAASGSGQVTTVNVDSSAEALELAAKVLQAQPNPAEFIQANVFDYLRQAGNSSEKFDVIVLDPPKFAHAQGQIQGASRGYKDINLNAMRLIASGGFLLTFSCSGAITPDLFQKIVFGALADSGRSAQILQHLGAGSDHPIALTFPEGEYLKGLLLRIY